MFKLARGQFVKMQNAEKIDYICTQVEKGRLDNV